MRLPSPLIAGCLLAAASCPAKPANLVFILTDNQGAWTLGCYGNPDIRTPHIDRLAAGGLRFNRALSSNPVCSPTRATFLTGLMPSQHGVHSFLDPKFMMGPEAYCQRPLKVHQFAATFEGSKCTTLGACPTSSKFPCKTP